ncbi:MAG: cupin domain-containing protein [Armatimonadetes bacterium]|nr:cupin domain-containing protein [Armatimonadota bacterium]
MVRREPYVTLDGSVVEEILRPEDGARRMSLALARIDEGRRTQPHRHRTSDEIYYVLQGEGVVYLGSQPHRVCPGEAVYIPAGTEHWAVVVSGPMEILCVCSPPYQHEDTDLSGGVAV